MNFINFKWLSDGLENILMISVILILLISNNRENYKQVDEIRRVS